MNLCYIIYQIPTFVNRNNGDYPERENPIFVVTFQAKMNINRVAGKCFTLLPATPFMKHTLSNNCFEL